VAGALAGLVVVVIVAALAAAPGRAARVGESPTSRPATPTPTHRASPGAAARTATGSPARDRANARGASPATLPSGVLNTHSGPFSTADFVTRDAWHGPVGSTWVWVYAGGTPTALGTRSVTRPGLRVYTAVQDGAEPYTIFQGFFTAPGADSPLTITGVSGTVLALRTDSGRVFHFDMQTKRFA
jgi:hypothetical protein